ncbi:MAG: beta-ureidopropionase [Armatimonadetes bacterium]|nr:beta-ureidopropionase [Armatimonadota bacterium]
MPFTLATIQVSPDKGDVSANLDRIAESAREALAHGADLCLYPESSASGYILEGGAAQVAMTTPALCEELARRLGGVKSQLDLLVGFYERTDGQPFNSAAHMSFGPEGSSIVHVYRKFFLPTYGVFDEERFHTRGRELGVYDCRLGRFGVLICEDVWHSVLSTLLAVNGAQILLVPSASPARGFANDKPGNVLRYERMLRSLSEEHGMYSAAAMLTGFEGGKGFSGGSMIYDPFGNMLAQCPVGEDGMVIATIDLANVEMARTQTPLVGDLRSVWSDIVRLVQQ